MRPLLILCEPKHAMAIRRGVERFTHPQLIKKFVSLIELDPSDCVDREDVHYKILERIRQQAWPTGTDGRPHVAATDAIYGEIGLKAFLHGRDVDNTKLYARDIGRLESNSGKTPQLKSVLASCGLTLHNASATLLSKWSHSVVDLSAITRWQNQLATLGKEYSWIAEFILRELVMTDPTDLTDSLRDLPIGDGVAACYNKDARGTPKSGEVVAGLLHKRDQQTKIHDAPATAIEAGTYNKIVVFEDGLWTGTEAIGILESLRGQRPHDRRKTRALANPSLINSCDLTLAYAVATDYGLALMRRYAKDHGLDRVTFWGAKEVPVAAPGVLYRLADPDYDPRELFVTGPAADSLLPYLIELARQRFGTEKAQLLQTFCATVGRQLFDNYLMDQVRDQNWTMDKWPEAKRALGALGMHSMALTHAFAHSVPKASLPLLWGKGPVTLGARKVDWIPLFQNA
jgi:hypothetical protein